MGGFSTTIEFGDRDVDLEQLTANATLGWQRSPRWGFLLTLGGVIDGAVTTDMERDVGPGFVGSVGATWLPLFETERRPFLLTSLSFGGSMTTAESDDGQAHRWTAFDLRLGAMLGKTFADRFTPFVAGRVFAGPVSWRLGSESETGGDAHKYTAGGGLSFRIPGSLDLFAEVMPVGEQSASLGGSLAF